MVRRLLKKKNIAKLMLICFLFSTVSLFFTKPLEVRAASATQLTQTFLDLANGKDFADITSVGELNYDDLRAIALYLSNFYIPFGTSLDGEETKDATKENMINALLAIGYNRDVASDLVDAVYASSLSSASKLYVESDNILDLDDFLSTDDGMYFTTDYVSTWRFSESGGSRRGTGECFGINEDTLTAEEYRVAVGDATVGTQEITINTNGKERDEIAEEENKRAVDYDDVPQYSVLTLAMTMRFLAAYTAPSGEHYDDDDTDIDVDDPVKVYYKNQGAYNSCFEFSEITADLFSIMTRKADFTNGYIGNAFFNGSYEDVASLSPSNFKALFSLTQPLYVDWVGNILVDIGTERVVVYPACMNPYTWNTGASQAESTQRINSSDYTITIGAKKYESNLTLAELCMDMGNAIVVGGSAEDQRLAGWVKLRDTLGLAQDSTLYPDKKDSQIKDIPEIDALPHEEIKQTSTSSVVDQKRSIVNLVSTYGLNLMADDNLFVFLVIDGKEKYNFRNAILGYYQIVQDRGSNTLLKTDRKLFGKDEAGEQFEAQLKRLKIYITNSPTGKEIGSYYLRGSHLGSVNKTVIQKVLDPEKVAGIKNVENISDLTSNIITLQRQLTKQGMYYFADTSSFNSLNDLNYTNWARFDGKNNDMLRALYLTYVDAYAIGYEKAKGSSVSSDGLNFWFNYAGFPKGLDGKINWTVVSTEEKAEDLLNMTWNILNPKTGLSYLKVLVKTKLGGLLIGWHEDMVGATASRYTTGTTEYTNTMGYVTAPRLDSIQWFDKLLENYDSIVVFLTVVALAILICFVIIGNMSISKAIISLVSFIIFSIVSPMVLNATVDITNRSQEKIYSDKFKYFAIAQMDNYLPMLQQEVNDASNGNFDNSFTVKSVIDSLDEDNDNTSSTYTSAYLKWQAPKRLNEGETAAKNVTRLTAMQSDVFSDKMQQSLYSAVTMDNTQVFADGATYLYRNILDLYKYSSVTYPLYAGQSTAFFNESDIKSHNFAVNSGSAYSNISNLSDFKYSSGMSYLYLLSGLSPQFNEFSRNINREVVRGTSSLYAQNRGFLNSTFGEFDSDSKYASGTLDYGSNTQALATNHALTLASKMTADIRANRQALEDGLSSNSVSVTPNTFGNTVYGLDPNRFVYSMTDYLSGTIDDDKLSMLYYTLYSESPYYFFSYNLRDQLSAIKGYNYDKSNLSDIAEYNKNDESGDIGSLNPLAQMWVDNNQDYFINHSPYAGDGYGELRDFMNFHDLFYYVIPLVDEGNKLVDLWDSYFGIYVYDDISLRINSAGHIFWNGDEYNTSDEFFQGVEQAYQDGKLTDETLTKLWHDYNVWTIINTYASWLDLMEDCKYAESETIKVSGVDYIVENPLDPTSYFTMDENGEYIEAGRFMIFSRSEMAYYGLNWADLTQVEQKLITVADNVYNDALDLMNYGSLSTEALINAYAFLMVFDFNKEFSQNAALGESVQLEPQGYELQTFSYDAFERMIVAEAAGNDVLVNNTREADASDENVSMYDTVLKKSSILFPILLILNDILALYIIPFLRLAFLVLTFLISLVLLTSAIFNIEMNILNVFTKSILKPLLWFGLVNIIFGYVISLFMSNGPTNIYNDVYTVDLGDPSSSLAAMLFINGVIVVLFFNMVKKAVIDLFSTSKALGNTVVGAVTGAAGVLAGSGLALAGVGQFSQSEDMARDGGGLGRGGSNFGSGKGDSGSRGEQNDPKNSPSLKDNIANREKQFTAKEREDFESAKKVAKMNTDRVSDAEKNLASANEKKAVYDTLSAVAGASGDEKSNSAIKGLKSSAKEHVSQANSALDRAKNSQAKTNKAFAGATKALKAKEAESKTVKGRMKIVGGGLVDTAKAKAKAGVKAGAKIGVKAAGTAVKTGAQAAKTGARAASQVANSVASTTANAVKSQASDIKTQAKQGSDNSRFSRKE